MRRIAIFIAALSLAVAAGSIGARADTAADAGQLRQCVTSAEAAGGDVVPCKTALSAPCLADPANSTTVAIIACYTRESEAWDLILNEDYQSLMAALTDAQGAALVDAETKWIAFRDADCSFQYALIDGTMAGINGASCVATATADRVFALRSYIPEDAAAAPVTP